MPEDEVDLTELMRAALEEVMVISGAQRSAFLLSSQSRNGALRDVICDALSDGNSMPAQHQEVAPDQIARASEIFAATLQRREIARINGTERDFWVATPFESTDIADVLAVPVCWSDGQIWGALLLGHTQSGYFSPSVERVVAGLGAQIALSLENAAASGEIRKLRNQAQPVASAPVSADLLVEMIPQIVWTATPHGGNDYLNGHWYQFTGLNFAQSTGDGWLQVIHPDDRPLNHQRWKMVMETGQPFDIEYRLRGHDGNYRWFLGLGRPFYDSDGNIIKWFGTCTDIDDQKRAEAALRCLANVGELLASSLDYEKTLENLASLIVPAIGDWCCIDVLRADGAIENLAMMHSDGAKMEIAREVRRRFAPNMADLVGVGQVLRSGNAELLPIVDDEILRLATRDEEHLQLMKSIDFASSMMVPLSVRGQVLGVLSVCAGRTRCRFDSDDLALAEELARRLGQAMDNAQLYRNMQSALNSAEEAGRAKDDFLATVSHELRTPLTAIMGWASLLRGGVADGKMLKSGLETIERNVHMQSQIIDDLLDVSRIVAGKLRLDMQSLEISRLVQTAIETVRPAIDAKNIRLEIHFHDGGSVLGDATRLQQVVWNLLSNAAKFTPEGGHIQVSLSSTASKVLIAIEDSGPGISAEFLPYVFERFQQADASLTRRHGGLGLGLAIARHLAEMHGGNVRVEATQPERGAVFVIELPLLAARGQAGLRAREVVASQASDGALLRDLRIVVVEDEEDSRAMIVAALQRYSAEVRAACDVPSALALLDEWRADALVSEIGLPEEDGLALIRRVRALSPEAGGAIPAVALTAYARDEDRTRALAAGFQSYLTKPVAPVELALVLAGLTGRSATADLAAPGL